MVSVQSMEDLFLEALIFELLDCRMSCIFDKFLNPIIGASIITFGSTVRLLKLPEDLVLDISVEIAPEPPEN